MFSFVGIHRDQRGKRERGSNAIYLLSCLLCSFLAVAFFLALFPCFPSPPALGRYLPLLLVVSSVQKLAVSLHQHVGCSLAAVLAFWHLSFSRAPPWRFHF